MSARIICVCNQKGGCGKTTITMSLAGAASGRGYQTLVVDGDPQGTAVSWSANATGTTPFPAAVVNLAHAGKQLPREVQKHEANYQLIFIDCPGSVENLIARVSLVVAHLALIPILPSPADLIATGPFLEMTSEATILNDSLISRIVPSMVDPSATRLSNAYLKQLDEMSVPRTKAEIGRRVAYREAMALGAPIHGDVKAVAEVEKLLDEVLTLLDLPSHHAAPK